ncbi:hypothetical protein BGZ60DRAFT_234610 [Tricladium varicosporioides]|nr:hypothetical protein BGZ60DRAFT_234610 [Hymenoscyphus varicosporioides]
MFYLQLPFVLGLLLGCVADNFAPNPVHLLPGAQTLKRQEAEDWFTGRPSSATLNWYPCYHGISISNYFCARLEVPYDYTRPKPGDIFKLAILKVPARTDVPYLGSLFLTWIDGHAIDFTQAVAELIYQQGVFAGYDIISWDPRGSGHTTPVLKCFVDDAAKSAYADFLGGSGFIPYGGFSGLFPPTEKNIRENIVTVAATYKKLNDGCVQYSSNLLPYMGTADNAKDLHTIVSLLQTGNKKKSMIFYGGTTAIGLTYAAMYPTEFDQILLYGAVNSEELFTSGLNSPSAIRDGEKALRAFFDSCSASSECTIGTTFELCNPGCYFWKPTANAVKARYEALKAKYYNTPWKSASPNPNCGDCTMTYNDIAHIISIGLDIPAGGFNMALHVSRALLEIETGNAISGGSIEYLKTNFGAGKGFEPYSRILPCLDAQSTIRDVDELEVHMKLMNRTSSQNGFLIASKEVQCSTWPKGIKLKNPYTSDFKAKIKGQMVFVSNTADAEQSLEKSVFPHSFTLIACYYSHLLIIRAYSAKKIASRFSNSRVITVNELGVCFPHLL